VAKELSSLATALSSKRSAIAASLKDFARLRRWLDVAALYRGQLSLLGEMMGAGAGTGAGAGAGAGGRADKHITRLCSMIVAQIKAEAEVGFQGPGGLKGPASPPQARRPLTSPIRTPGNLPLSSTPSRNPLSSVLSLLAQHH
jgi:hypothetical protein